MLTNSLWEHLKNFEFGIIPYMILNNEYSIEYLQNHFKEISEKFFQDLNIDISTEKFAITLHNFQFQNEPVTSVIVFHFPFRKTKQYYGLAKRLYCVYYRRLKQMHLYLEVLRDNSHRSEYNIYYIRQKNNVFSYEFITSRDVFNEETLAGNCAIWSSFEEVNQQLIKPVPFNNIKK